MLYNNVCNLINDTPKTMPLRAHKVWPLKIHNLIGKVPMGKRRATPWSEYEKKRRELYDDEHEYIHKFVISIWFRLTHALVPTSSRQVGLSSYFWC